MESNRLLDQVVALDIVKDDGDAGAAPEVVAESRRRTLLK